MTPTFTRTVTLDDVTRGLKFTVPADIGPELAKQVAEFNADAETVLDSVAGSATVLRRALDGIAEADNAGSLNDAVSTSRFLRVEAAQAAVQLWRQRGELGEAVLSELRTKVEPAKQKLTAATEATRAGLDTLGIDEGTMIAGGWNAEGVRNPTAAAAQLRHVISTALPVREAQRTALDAENAVRAAVQQISTSDAGLTKATKAVRSIAEKSVQQLA